MLSNVNQSGKSPTFLWFPFNSKSNVPVKQSPKSKILFGAAQYTPLDISGRMGYVNLLHVKKAYWKLQKVEQRKPPKMKAAHIFKETIAHYFC